MASSAPLTTPSDKTSKSFFGFGASFIIHAVIAYLLAIRISPWLIYHCFWLASLLRISISTPPGDWFLQHMELASILPAIVLGYFSDNLFGPYVHPVLLGRQNWRAAAIWTWVVPFIVLSFRMLLYPTAHSVLYGSSADAFRYFFDIQRVMPSRNNLFAADITRILAQMRVTAPFYAGLAYSLGALASRHDLLTKLFVFEHLEEADEPDVDNTVK